MDLVAGLVDMVGALAPTQQNGKSLWGTLLAQTLPLWIIGKGGIHQCPWGGLTCKNSNPYEDAPFTGMTRKYEFNVSRAVIAPDGYERSVLLVNDQFPGPLLEANWGDWIEVKVNNHIEDEGTAIHWHGFLQTGTEWSDGTPGVSQCPVAPDTSYTYRFRAELYGSSWYHSHYSAQWAGGLLGPIVVHGPTHVKYDIDIGPVMVSDWWHEDYYTIVEEIMAPGATGRTYSDNNLINGKNNFNCDPSDPTPCTEDAGLSKFQFQSGKKHRLRFVNTGAEAVQRISLDGHNMTVIANDFVPIEPYETQVVTLGIGQRTDVVIQAHEDTPNGAYWLRSNISSCSNTKQPYALAVVYYDDADTNAVPDSEPWNVPDPGTCANDPLELTHPVYPIDVPEPDWTEYMDISSFRNESDVFLWKFAGISARVNYNDPTFKNGVRGDLEAFNAEDNVHNYDRNSSLRLIVNNPTPAPHPMHAHGMNFFVLSAGPGYFYSDSAVSANASLVASATTSDSSLDTTNPQRRDVQNIQPFGHMVIQIDAERNPGLWPFHCHIAWHASQGFFAQLLLQPDELVQYASAGFKPKYWPWGTRGVAAMEQQAHNACIMWDQWTRGEVVDQIDSGL